MKEIVIISGKGGTGKTSLVAAFASLAGKKVLCDADVDAADLHLITNPSVKERHDFQSGHDAIINAEKCTQCGLCRELCRWNAVREDFTIDSIDCEGCGVCVYFCPEKAIDFPVKTCGEWYISETRFGPMVHARLGIAEENSGKLVTQVRQEAKKLADANGIGLILTDGAPGVGCPVIASLGGADTALIVTEPSKSGIHDMERVINVAEHFKVPVKVIINKFDINRVNTGEIEKYLEKRKIEVLGKIPFSEKFDSALKQAKTINEFDPGCAEAKMVEEIKIRMESGSQAR